MGNRSHKRKVAQNDLDDPNVQEPPRQHDYCTHVNPVSTADTSQAALLKRSPECQSSMASQ